MKFSVLVSTTMILVSQISYATDYALSEKCGKMVGQQSVKFHGEGLPFSQLTYTANFSFPAGKLGYSVSTNFGAPDLTNETLDFEGLTDSYLQYYVFPSTEVFDCNARPDSCLSSVNSLLRILIVAQTYPIKTADDSMKATIACAIERTRLFNRKVRTEVLQQRQVVQ